MSGLLLMFEILIHIAVPGYRLFISISVFYCMNILYQLYWWTFDGHLVCFQFGAFLKYCFEHSSACLSLNKEGKKKIHLLSNYDDLLYHYWGWCHYTVTLMLLIRELMKTKKVIQTPTM